jgi:hypothetical protein
MEETGSLEENKIMFNRFTERARKVIILARRRQAL